MIEDKRKFDIMEFVSCTCGKGKGKGKGRNLLMESRREEGKSEGSFLSYSPCSPWPQVLRLVEAQAMHFQQGHEELSRLAQYRKELGAQVGPHGAGR